MAKGVKTGGGSRKGIPNKDVALGREAIARFVDDNAERMQGWLDQIAEDSPEKAFNCVRDLLEYHIPKLQRRELTGKDGDDLSVTHRVDNPDEIIERYMKRKQQKEQIDV